MPDLPHGSADRPPGVCSGNCRAAWSRLQEAERAASAFGLTLVVVDASNRNYERAFAKIAAERDRVTEERPHAEERLS